MQLQEGTLEKVYLAAGYRARTAQAYGDIGYTFTLGGLRLEPFAGLAYVNVNPKRYEEQTGVAALHGSGASVGMTYGTLGLRGEMTFDLGDYELTANGTAGWRRGFKRGTPSATHSFDGSSPFVVYGAPFTRDAAVIELGLDAAFTESLTLGLYYSGLFGKAYQDQGVRGTLNWRF